MIDNLQGSSEKTKQKPCTVLADFDSFKRRSSSLLFPMQMSVKGSYAYGQYTRNSLFSTTFSLVMTRYLSEWKWITHTSCVLMQSKPISVWFWMTPPHFLLQKSKVLKQLGPFLIGGVVLVFPLTSFPTEIGILRAR